MESLFVHSWTCSCLMCNLHILFNHGSQCKANNGKEIKEEAYFKFVDECQQFPYFVMKVEWIKTCWNSYGLSLGFNWGQKAIQKFDLLVKNRSWKHWITHFNVCVTHMFSHKFFSFSMLFYEDVIIGWKDFKVRYQENW